MGGAGTPVRVDHELAWIEALLDRHLPHQVGHLELDDAHRAGGCLDRGHPERLGDAPERPLGRLAIQRHLAAEEVVRVVAAEQEVRIRDRRPDASTPVARRAGVGTGALWTDPERPRLLVHPDDRAAARADRLDQQARHVERVLVDDRLGRRDRLTVVKQPDVEARAAHVAGDHFRVPEHICEELRPGDSPDRPGANREERRLCHLGSRHDTARRLHDQQRLLVATLARRVVEPLHVPRCRRPDVAVDRSRCRSLVLARLRDQLVRTTDEQVGRQLPHDLLHAALVVAVDEAPEEADGDPFDAFSDELRDRPARLLLVERQEDVPRPVDALRNLLDQLGRNDRIGLAVPRDVEQLLDREARGAPIRAHHDQRIAVTSGRDQPRLGPAHLHEHVRPDGCPVQEQLDLAEHLRRAETALGRRRGDRVEESLGEVLWRGRNLRKRDRASVVNEHAVGERSTDVDTAVVAHVAPCLGLDADGSFAGAYPLG